MLERKNLKFIINLLSFLLCYFKKKKEGEEFFLQHFNLSNARKIRVIKYQIKTFGNSSFKKKNRVKNE